MPRPGPRPYECVRRAWHSDRHQPMRGSIIQQIFRVVSEHHSVVTKKNKEWQEKLPLVVLKAEEIMYSKANSEDEYMNMETLWGRVNDAINTIIRRDEDSETGEFLPPCVEAALNLGCVPVRTSRSQRHSNPRSYLNPRIRVSPPANQSKFSKLTITEGSSFPIFQSNRNLNEVQHNLSADRAQDQKQNCHLLFENIPSITDKVGSVYPMCYRNLPHIVESYPITQMSDHKNSNIIFIGKPVGTSIASSSTDTDVASPRVGDVDLSLRLGLLSDNWMSKESFVSEAENGAGSRTSLYVEQLGNNKNADDSFESCSIKWLGISVRKRKAQKSGDVVEDWQCCRRHTLSS